MQEAVEEMVVDSIVLNPSNASATQQLAGEEVNHVHFGQNHLQVDFVRTFFGPALPLVYSGKEISKLLFSLSLPMKCTSLCFRVHSLYCCFMVLGQMS
jgi:hypothetical protein